MGCCELRLSCILCVHEHPHFFYSFMFSWKKRTSEEGLLFYQDSLRADLGSMNTCAYAYDSLQPHRALRLPHHAVDLRRDTTAVLVEHTVRGWVSPSPETPCCWHVLFHAVSPAVRCCLLMLPGGRKCFRLLPSQHPRASNFYETYRIWTHKSAASANLSCLFESRSRFGRKSVAVPTKNCGSISLRAGAPSPVPCQEVFHEGLDVLHNSRESCQAGSCLGLHANPASRENFRDRHVPVCGRVTGKPGGRGRGISGQFSLDLYRLSQQTG